jgi:predicted O-methyltransferase YrrM
MASRSLTIRAATAKVAGRDAERASRLHTRRGQVVLPGFASALLARRRPPQGPWMAPAAVRRLETLLGPNLTLLELGSGSSTAWYAERCKQVVSVEPDPAWARSTRAAVGSAGNVEVIEESVADYLGHGRPADVVIVDHLDEPGHSRVDSIRAVCASAAIVVLDDSDRTAYRTADSVLLGWPSERFVGYRPRPLQPTETTIWCRPADSRLDLAGSGPG